MKIRNLPKLNSKRNKCNKAKKSNTTKQSVKTKISKSK